MTRCVVTQASNGVRVDVSSWLLGVFQDYAGARTSDSNVIFELALFGISSVSLMYGVAKGNLTVQFAQTPITCTAAYSDVSPNNIFISFSRSADLVSGTIDCGSLVSVATINSLGYALGAASPLCYVLDSLTLLVIGAGAGFNGVSLTFLASSPVGPASCAAVPAFNPRPPVAIINGPSSVPTCDFVVLDASASTGVDWSSSFLWSAVGPTAFSPLTTASSVLNISASQLAAGFVAFISLTI